VTQLTHPLDRSRRTWLPGAVLICVVAAAAAVALALTSRSENHPAQPIRTDARLGSGRATPASLRALAAADLGPTTDVPRYPAANGLERVRDAGCRGGACVLAFNTDYTPADHTIAQLIEQQGPMLAASFTDARLRSLTVVTYGPSSAN